MLSKPRNESTTVKTRVEKPIINSRVPIIVKRSLERLIRVSSQAL